MSRKHKFRDNDKLYFISYAIIRWIDLFIRDEYRSILLDSWKYCIANKGLEVYGWCIMTSHVHMIIGSGKTPMRDIVRDMKRHTSEKLRLAIRSHTGESRKEWMVAMMEAEGRNNSNNISFQLWQQHNHPVELLDHRMAWQKLNYIHDNPVKAGFVDKAGEYVYSSARDYFTGKSRFIDLVFLEPEHVFV